MNKHTFKQKPANSGWFWKVVYNKITEVPSMNVCLLGSNYHVTIVFNLWIIFDNLLCLLTVAMCCILRVVFSEQVSRCVHSSHWLCPFSTLVYPMFLFLFKSPGNPWYVVSNDTVFLYQTRRFRRASNNGCLCQLSFISFTAYQCFCFGRFIDHVSPKSVYFHHVCGCMLDQSIPKTFFLDLKIK